jgi:hypothetical protein
VRLAAIYSPRMTQDRVSEAVAECWKIRLQSGFQAAAAYLFRLRENPDWNPEDVAQVIAQVQSLQEQANKSNDGTPSL